MNPTIRTALLSILIGLCGCSLFEREVNGTVFIATNGGDNIRLGDAYVRFFDADSMDRFARKKSELITRVLKQDWWSIDMCEQIYRKCASPNFYAAYTIVCDSGAEMRKVVNGDMTRSLNNALNPEQVLVEVRGDSWPDFIAETQTDADGKFSTKLEDGRYALMVSSSRQVDDVEEDYAWCVWVNVNSKLHDPIVLSNDNLFNPKDFLFLDTVFAWEEYPIYPK